MSKLERDGDGLRLAISLCIAAFVVAADQLTKLWVRANLVPGESLPETGFLRLTYTQNTGVAFGLFTDHSFLLSIVAIVGLVAVLFLYRYPLLRNTWGSLALSLVFGGAAGNLIDRFRLGYVTDFIDVRLWHGYHWPCFNIADSAITVGCILLLCYIAFMSKKEDVHSARK